MATITSSPTGGNLTVNGNTQVNGTISWTKPTVPSGATINSCVLTGTATASMSKGSATITVNGTTVTSGTLFTINLGTANNTTSVTTTVKGGNKNSAGTVSFSNLIYTVTYEEAVQVKTYTVTFVDWNGTILKTQEVEQGSSATAPNNPTRDGYNFTGWDKTFNNVTSDLTITAQYEIINVPSSPMVDKSATLRPISAVQDSGYNNTWTNISNAYDVDTSTSSTFSITGSGQAGFVKNTVSTIFNFDTSVIPANAVINSATLTVRAKSSAATNLYISVDANSDSSKRIMDETLMGSTSTKDYTGDATDYIKGLNNISLTHRTAGSSTRTFTCYDIRIDVDYSVPSDAELLNTVIINANEDWGYVKNLATNEIYTGTNITVTGPNTEAIDLMIYPNEGYHIASVSDDFFSEDIGPFTQYPCGLEASVGSNTQTYTYIVTYAKNEGPEESKTQNLVIGDMIIDELFIGGQEIEEIYIGDNLLFKK